MSDPITVIAIFQPKPSLADEFVAVMGPMVEGSNAEPGCLRYDLFEDGDGRFYLLEVYADEEALEAHRGTAHYAAYRAQTADMLTAPVEVHKIRPARRSATP